MVTLLNPGWLWGLAGLTIPVAIHLLSRKEGKTMLFGSLRFLSDSITSQFKSLRLNEVLLLLIRCAAIIVLVLYLAGLTFELKTKNESWLLVENGLENSPEVATIKDSLVGAGFKQRFFKIGFPEEDASENTALNYWALIEDLNEKQVEDIVIMSKQLMRNARGERVALPENIRWIHVPPRPDTFLLRSVLKNKDSLWIRSGITSEWATFYQNNVDPVRENNNFQNNDSIKIFIHYDAGYTHEKNLLAACLKAIQSITPSVIQTMSDSVMTNEKHEWYFDLGKLHPADKHKSVSLKILPSPLLPLLIPDTMYGLSHNRWIITRRITVEDILHDDFVMQLGRLLLEDHTNHRNDMDNRVIPDEMLWAKQHADNNTLPSARKAGNNAWLLVLFIITLAIERLVAMKRMQ